MRIIHRILGTNVVLKEMGIANSNSCSFCKQEKESIQHIFWGCNVIQQFWRGIETMFNTHCDLANNMKISEDLALFGKDNNLKTDAVVDFIIMFAKYYIHSCKMKIIIPDIAVFKKKMGVRYKIEEYNAKIEMRYMQFCTRWCYYKAMFMET